MHNPLIRLGIAALMLLAAGHAQAQRRTGIPEIDSLPVHDWGRSPERLSYSAAFAFSLLPGGGQFYGRHPVRGSFLLGLETLLGGLALYSRYMDIPEWKREAREALDSADALFLEMHNDPARASSLESDRRFQIAFARQRMGLVAQQTDLVNSEIAWALGLHLYGTLDAMEIAYLSRNPPPRTRSVRTALFRGLVPGGGQIYNRRYGKFGMLWMAFGASAVSAISRQQMVDQLSARLRVARAEGDADAVEELDTDRTLYRKRRNQYFWGITLFYIYSVLDGMVDAVLSDFDSPKRFALTAGPEGSVGLQASLPISLGKF